METKWRVGLIGVGARGMSHLSGILTERDDVTITCIADRIEERAENAAKLVQEKMGNTPWITTDWRRIADQPDSPFCFHYVHLLRWLLGYYTI